MQEEVEDIDEASENSMFEEFLYDKKTTKSRVSDS